MKPLAIKEDTVSRQWLSSEMRKAGMHIAFKSKGGTYSIGVSIVLALVLFWTHAPVRAWEILFFPMFMPLIGAIMIIISPFWALPQSWILEDKSIKARGFRFNGSVKWESIIIWSVQKTEGLADYYYVYFKSIKWGDSNNKSSHAILVHPSIPIDQLTRFFKNYCPDKYRKDIPLRNRK
jgi:hypothetical protein